MRTYTYSEARQKLASLLEEARSAGSVRIRRKDGQEFDLLPGKKVSSPLNVGGVDAGLSAEEIVAFVREGRERQDS